MRKRGGTFRWGQDRDPWTFAFSMATLGGADYAFQVERSRFDALLFENAREHGVDTREGIEVVATLVDDRRISGVVARDDHGAMKEIRARYVIDASGHGSRLARLAGRRIYSKFFRNVAVYGYYRGAARLPEPNAGNILTSAFEHGWCWFIPLSDELSSVGAVVDRRHAGLIKGDRIGAYTRFVETCPLVGEHLQGAERVMDGMYGKVRVRKDWSYSNERLHADGLLLVGDAACFVDPVFSSGVHLGTYAGMLAARSVSTALDGHIDEAVCVREFDRRYRREFRLFYEFLLAFYDMDQDWDSYYWNARTTLGTDERGNEAFIRLVAGGASAPSDFFGERNGLGRSFERMIAVAADKGPGEAGTLPERLDDAPRPDVVRLNRERARESVALLTGGGEEPLFRGGLVPSADGLRWAFPSAS